MFSEAFALGKVGNADKKLKINLYQVDLFSKGLKETMKNSYVVDKCINKLSRGITEFPELFLQTPLSMDIYIYIYIYIYICVCVYIKKINFIVCLLYVTAVDIKNHIFLPQMHNKRIVKTNQGNNMKT